MTAATRLEAALQTACDALMEVVGFPVDAADEFGERFPVSGSLVAHDEVPDVAWRAAIAALTYTLTGCDVMDPESASVVSVEDGLAALTRETA